LEEPRRLERVGTDHEHARYVTAAHTTCFQVLDAPVGETAIALALIFGLFSNLTYVNGALLLVIIWTKAEGFGGPYTAGSTDIGAAIIYVSSSPVCS
jgi:hypothetical protein